MARDMDGRIFLGTGSDQADERGVLGGLGNSSRRASLCGAGISRIKTPEAVGGTPRPARVLLG